MRTTTTLLAALTMLATVLLAPDIFGQTCESDADCAQGMLCHSQTVTTCTGGAGIRCEPDGVCTTTPPEPPVCTDSTVSRCAYRWQLPCNRDADCGDEFVCRPLSVTTCSASAPSTPGTGSAAPGSAGGGAASGTGGGAGGEEAPVPPLPVPSDGGAGSAPACTTSTSYPGTCQSKVTTCTSDADCPASWTCSAASQPTRVPVPAAVDAGPATSVPPDSTAATKTCQPPSNTPRTGGGAEGTGGAPGTLATSPDAGAGKGATPPPPPASIPDGGFGNGPSPPPTQGAADTTVDGGVGKGTTPSTPPAPTANGGEAPGTAAEAAPASTGGGGCSLVSGGAQSGAVIFLGLLAALALIARKRS